jgi:hypothetical protein
VQENIFKNKFYLVTVVILSICLTLVSSIITFATTDNTNTIIQKQQEIDKYLFEEHAKEIEEKGFTITHTSPLEGYVEIGITPFNKENTDYLYEIFGNDNVKVVEGQQATLMNDVTSTEDKNTFMENSLISGIVIVAAVGTIFFVTKKRKTAK